MRSVRLALPDDVAAALDSEADLLGFESTRAYLGWLVDNRLALDHDGERGETLRAYRTALADVRDAGPALPDAARIASERIEAVTDSEMDAHVAPRTERVADDTLETTADALSTVREERLDVVARRAVTETRERLGDAGTGLDYRSQTSVSGAERPGQDIADLSAIEVPGWDESDVERRRDAVGAALAFLRDAEAAKRGEFVAELFAEYPAGYESESAWWECIKRGLRQVDRVIPANEDSRVWRFRTTPGRVTRISF